MVRYSFSPTNVASTDLEDDNEGLSLFSSPPSVAAIKPTTTATTTDTTTAAAFVSTTNVLKEDDEDDSEEEDEHPLGFSSCGARYGVTRFGLRPPKPTVNELRVRYGYVPDDYDLIDDDWWGNRGAMGKDVVSKEPDAYLQQFPPVESSFIPRTTATTRALTQYNDPANSYQAPTTDADEELAALMQHCRITAAQSTRPLTSSSVWVAVGEKVKRVVDAAEVERQGIARRAQAEHQKVVSENQTAFTNLRNLLKQDYADAKRVVQEEKKAKEQAEHELKQEQEREAALRAKQEAEAAALEKKEKERLAKEAAVKKKEEEERRIAEELAAKKTEFVRKAQKYIDQLVQCRSSVAPFESSKDPIIKRRRLGMKKLVRGKVNTLNADDPNKVRAVAAEIVATIQAAKQEDDHYKAQQPPVAPELTRGKRYLVDLLASTAMQRMQADGFNGPRGDGFPLAGLLAHVSVEVPQDVVPVIMAHVFTVCPVAIPNLPSSSESKKDNDDQLMEALGMQKDSKTGDFETFDRFLTRTEGIIAFMANVMSSQPHTHVLFGGHKGARDWLKRFLELIIQNGDDVLPILTAPVLDGFLTAAGHMMANVYADDFRKQLDQITTKVVPRLDKGTIGAPRALRLEKVLDGGFEKFRSTLPDRAMRDLYVTSTSGSAAAPTTTAPTTPFGTSTATSTAPTIASTPFGKPNPPTNPVGTSSGTSNNPFGGSTSTPFGGSSTPATSNPFGGSTGLGAGTGPQGTPAFGASAPMGFAGDGMDTSNNAPAPFGQTVPSPFGTKTPFGVPSSSSSPFGTFGATATPFGTSTTSAPFGTAAPAPGSSFGTKPAAASSTPFGNNPAPAPFGSPTPFGNPAPAPTPFGTAAPSPTPFGTRAPGPTPFGTAAPSPAPFGTATPAPTPFGTAAPGSTPFGTVAPSPTPFGTAAPSPTPFGSVAPNPTPFGVAAPAPTPFGSAAPTPTPFGSPSPAPFGGAANQQTTPFGGNGNPGGKKKAPCKYFAQGNCRSGANCRFSHEKPSSFGGAPAASSTPFGSSFGPSNQQQPKTKKPCKFFAQGKCRNGANCAFSHEQNQQQQPFGRRY